MSNRGTTPMRRGLLDARSVHALLLTCLVGCDGPRKVAVYSVAGTLTVSGQPAANAMVAFHPLDQAGSRTPLPVACTGPDGSYRLMTYAVGDGAPAGEYTVTVIWPDDSQPWDECVDDVAHDRFRGRYADPARSPWRVTIRPGTNEVPLRASLPAQVDPSPGYLTPRESDRPAMLPVVLIASDKEAMYFSVWLGGRLVGAADGAAVLTRAAAQGSLNVEFLDVRMPDPDRATVLAPTARTVAVAAVVPDDLPRSWAVCEPHQGDSPPPGEAVRSGFVPPSAGDAAGPTRRSG